MPEKRGPDPAQTAGPGPGDAAQRDRGPQPERAQAEESAPKARAAESSDPAVQQLIAELQTAELNQDEEAAKDVHRRLDEMGFTL